MKIDEYLKHSPIFSLFHAQQTISQELTKVLLDEHVNFLEALMLITILFEGHQRVTPGLLVKTFQCSKARLSQMLARLEAQGWLHRAITHEDARSYALSLSSTGIAKANRLIRCMDRLERTLEQAMSQEALASLTLHLHRLRAGIRQVRVENGPLI